VKQELHFFIGKGGVGKSTTSALCAIHYAEQAHDTLLVSMDPAHNQRDIFCRKFSEKPVDVSQHLTVKEVDTDYWIAKYLEDTEKQIHRAYGYHTAFNLQSCFNVLRFSPGLEEYAMLLAFENVLHASARKDIIIFDMPPTALSLKFFSLPFITLVWLDDIGIPVRRIVLNKVTPKENDTCDLNELDPKEVIRFPLSDAGLYGLTILNEYLKRFSPLFPPAIV